LTDYRHPQRFLGLDDESSAEETSAAWVLPIPFEMTTSYAGGTKLGPALLIEASNQVELYDAEIGSEAAVEYGVYTLPHLHPTLTSPEAAMHGIRDAVRELELGDRVLVTLGGEHSITPGIVHAFAERHPDLVVVQIDAHSDLRDEFEGTPYSHACAARRWIDAAPTIQFGIRSICQEEADFIRDSDRVKVFSASDMYRDRNHEYLNALKAFISDKPSYLTIDVDGLDPSIISATGTPEPGGILWYDCLELIQTVAQNSRIVAFDCVELSTGSHASAFAAAKLVYKTLNYIMRAAGKV
jgi:agmatinase